MTASILPFEASSHRQLFVAVEEAMQREIADAYADVFTGDATLDMLCLAELHRRDPEKAMLIAEASGRNHDARSK